VPVAKHSKEKAGDCPGGLKQIYANFNASFASVPEWERIPWGLGAWGANKNNKYLELDDRTHCIDGVRTILESGDFPKLKASISFNSLGSRIDDEQSPELKDTFSTLLNSPIFYEHDLIFADKLARNKDKLCANNCDDRCFWSWLSWDKKGTGAMRCNPDGFEFADEECESNYDGECDGCRKSTCHWSWPWEDEDKEESVDATCRCKP